MLHLLLEAAEAMKQVDDCYCYIVGMNQDEPDSVYVYEVWENEAAHKASLSLDAVKVLIASALPIIENMTRDVELTIYGGKAKL